MTLDTPCLRRVEAGRRFGLFLMGSRGPIAARNKLDSQPNRASVWTDVLGPATTTGDKREDHKEPKDEQGNEDQ